MGWVSRIPQVELPMRFSDGKIRFVWVTDAHVDVNTNPAVLALDKAISDCNDWRPNAFICTGDMASNRLDHDRLFLYHTKSCVRPVYSLLGDHDLSEYAPGSYGHPDVAEVAGETVMGFGPPFYYHTVISSPDGSFSALCLFLETCFYDNDPTETIPPSEYHNIGDRWGISDIMPGGGWYKQIPQTELDWIAATLAANSSDAVFVFMHQTPIAAARITNLPDLADVLQPDHRPIIGFSGHIHSWAAPWTLTSTDTLRDFTFYSMTDMNTSFGWCRATLGFAAGNITIDGLDIYNFTDPGGYTISSPFSIV